MRGSLHLASCDIPSLRLTARGLFTISTCKPRLTYWHSSYAVTTCKLVTCRYLYKSNSQGVQDYLCNRLYTLPEADVEGYLLQLVYLVLQRPNTSLERVLIDLCARSLRIAAKVMPPRLCSRSMPHGEACVAHCCVRPR